jgi:hypothetical protein
MPVKTYYSTIPFSTLHIMRSPGFCEQVQILGGQITTDDPTVMAHLDEIVDKPGSGIFSSSPRSDSPDVIAAHADARADAEKAHARMVASGLSTA